MIELNNENAKELLTEAIAFMGADDAWFLAEVLHIATGINFKNLSSLADYFASSTFTEDEKEALVFLFVVKGLANSTDMSIKELLLKDADELLMLAKEKIVEKIKEAQNEI